jgi:hypothetical protein
MKRAAILLAIGFAAGLPFKAQAAVTKSILLACKEEADLRQAAKLRSASGDRKAAAEFEAGKKASGGCIEIPRNTVVGVDQRKPPLVCVRQSGGLDCYWTILSAIDEYLTAPVAPREAPPPKKNH